MQNKKEYTVAELEAMLSSSVSGLKIENYLEHYNIRSGPCRVTLKLLLDHAREFFVYADYKELSKELKRYVPSTAKHFLVDRKTFELLVPKQGTVRKKDPEKIREIIKALEELNIEPGIDWVLAQQVLPVLTHIKMKQRKKVSVLGGIFESKSTARGLWIKINYEKAKEKITSSTRPKQEPKN